MIPTFDFSNVIRKIILSSAWTFINPITWTLLFATTIGGIVTLVCSKLSAYVIPSIPHSFSAPSSSFGSFISYIFALDHLLNVLNSFISFVNLLIPFSITTLVSFVGACYVFRQSTVLRSAWTSLLSK